MSSDLPLVEDGPLRGPIRALAESGAPGDRRRLTLGLSRASLDVEKMLRLAGVGWMGRLMYAQPARAVGYLIRSFRSK